MIATHIRRCSSLSGPLVLCERGKFRDRRGISGGPEQHNLFWRKHLAQRSDHFVRPAGTVFAIACTPDGMRLATGGSDQTIRIWDAQKITEILQLRGHTSYVWSLAFSPDGSQLASGSGDGTVRVWDIRPFREVLQARTKHDAIVARLLPHVQEQLRANSPAAVIEPFLADPSINHRERQVIRQLVLQDSLKETDSKAQYDRSLSASARSNLQWSRCFTSMAGVRLPPPMSPKLWRNNNLWDAETRVHALVQDLRIRNRL